MEVREDFTKRKERDEKGYSTLAPGSYATSLLYTLFKRVDQSTITHIHTAPLPQRMPIRRGVYAAGERRQTDTHMFSTLFFSLSSLARLLLHFYIPLVDKFEIPNQEFEIR